MRHISKENTKRYKSNAGEILHNDATSTDIIARITTIPEIKSTGCLTKAMVIGDGIINKGYVVDVLKDTSPGNDILGENCWMKKVENIKIYQLQRQ